MINKSLLWILTLICVTFWCKEAPRSGHPSGQNNIFSLVSSPAGSSFLAQYKLNVLSLTILDPALTTQQMERKTVESLVNVLVSHQPEEPPEHVLGFPPPEEPPQHVLTHPQSEVLLDNVLVLSPWSTWLLRR